MKVPEEALPVLKDGFDLEELTVPERGGKIYREGNRLLLLRHCVRRHRPANESSHVLGRAVEFRAPRFRSFRPALALGLISCSALFIRPVHLTLSVTHKL